MEKWLIEDYIKGNGNTQSEKILSVYTHVRTYVPFSDYQNGMNIKQHCLVLSYLPQQAALLVPTDALYEACIVSCVDHCDVVQFQRDVSSVQLPNQRCSGPVPLVSGGNVLVLAEQKHVIIVAISVPADVKVLGVKRWGKTAGQDD